MAEILLTVVMPALNEEANIEAAVRATLGAFDRMGINGELVVVDDGSTDETGQRVRQLMAGEPRLRLVRHETPRGVGAAFWRGVAESQGELLCFLPGDNENDPEEILRYHGLLREVDFVVPFVFNREIRSRFRNSVSSLFRMVVNASFGVTFNYTNGTVLYRRRVLEALDCHCTSFWFTTDILVRLNRRGYLFAEVPYRLRRRSRGHSRALMVRSLLRVAQGYLRAFCDCNLRARGPAALVEGSATARRRGGGGLPPSARGHL
jgi:dolichol-phosphate mannosyltransferase